MLKAIFIWIYCMDYSEALILLAFFTGLFCAVKKIRAQHRGWRAAVILMLLLWTAVVMMQTILRRTPDTSFQPIWKPFQSYIDALKEGGQIELLRSNFMNAVLFYPGGVLLVSILPAKWTSVGKVFAAFAVLTVFSAAIEFIQYRYCLGLAQTDDVIHNSLGALLGAVICVMISDIKLCKSPHK